MKYITLLSFLLISELCSGRCGNALVVYPQSSTIAQNEQILIEASGWGKAHDILKSLDDNYPVYLNSKSGKIRLIKLDYKRGHKNWSQVLLAPESKLQVGETYVLVIDNLSLNDRVYVNIDRLYRHGGFRSAGWVAGREQKTKHRLLDQKIETLKSEVIRYGCGPSVETTFNLSTEQFNESIIMAEVLDQTLNTVSIFYLVVADGKVIVGHDMCSGPYTFKKGRSYRIRFADNYMDEKVDYTDWMKCENPWDSLDE